MPYFTADYRPPRVSVLSNSLTAMVGDTVQVMCIYKGEPSPVARWLKDGQEVSSARSNYIRYTAVELEDVSESFVLTCLADNGLDTASVRVFVKVTGGRRDNNGLFTVVCKLATRLWTPQR